MLPMVLAIALSLGGLLIVLHLLSQKKVSVFCTGYFSLTLAASLILFTALHPRFFPFKDVVALPVVACLLIWCWFLVLLPCGILAFLSRPSQRADGIRESAKDYVSSRESKVVAAFTSLGLFWWYLIAVVFLFMPNKP